MVRRETSKMFRHYSLRKSQTRAQVFSVNCSVICNFAALLTSSVQYGIILPDLVHSGWFWLIMLVILANRKRRNNWFPEGPDIKCFVKGLNLGVHFKSRLSMIVLVILVLNIGLLLLTVTDVSTTCAVVMFRVKKWLVSRQLMVLNSGYWPDWSIKSRCYWSSVS